MPDPHEPPTLFNGAAALSREAPLYIAPSGTYGGDRAAPGLLASADARVHYPGSPASPVRNEASFSRSVRVTILNGTGSGWFRAGYAVRGQDLGVTAGGFASVRMGTGSVETFLPDGVDLHGYLPAHPFTFNEPQTIEMHLRATATGDVRPNHSGPDEVSAHSEITGLAGYDGATNRFYSLTYEWDPV